MGVVRFALRFPHTFYVLAALILFLGITAIRAMPTDIFPEIRIPVVTVIWGKRPGSARRKWSSASARTASTRSVRRNSRSARAAREDAASEYDIRDDDNDDRERMDGQISCRGIVGVD